MKVVHEWLKDYIGDPMPSVAELSELLTFHAFEIEEIEKVGEHEVIDIKILPDRGSDCLSHRGIAREIASITGVPLANDPLQNAQRLPSFAGISVDIEDTHACSRFAAALIENIEVKDSPSWLQERLRALGQRPINNIVDATNYVMYALGQPLHAYDAKKFPQMDGVWEFQVRFAKSGEEVSLIAEGGKNEDRIVALEGTELLIVDQSSNRPIGLAGVKGGSYAGVDKNTTSIIVEAAHFDPIITRKTARRLGIVIDASKRFENNPSPLLIPHALREVVELIIAIAGGTCAGAVDFDHTEKTQTTVAVPVAKVNGLLGLTLHVEEMQDILMRIGAQVEASPDILTVVSPFERTDLNIPEDYVEEIGRIHGYQDILSVVPSSAPLGEINARQYYSDLIRTLLVQQGFSEVVTSSFRKKDVIELRNALASDKSYLRSTLSKNIAEVLDRNAGLSDLLGAVDTRVFEIGTVFNKGADGFLAEHVSLCFGVRTKVQGFVQSDDTLIGSLVESLSKGLGVTLSCSIEKGIAECDLSALLLLLPVPSAYALVSLSQETAYKPFSLYPAVVRDIALWVSGNIQAQEVEEIINAQAGSLRVRTTLFDEFVKEGRTSYAFRLIFQSHDKTLTDQEVNLIMDKVYKAVQEKGWETR